MGWNEKSSRGPRGTRLTTSGEAGGVSELEAGEDESDGVPVGCSSGVSELETGEEESDRVSIAESGGASELGTGEDKSNGVSVGESAGGPIGAIGAGWTAVVRSCCM